MEESKELLLRKQRILTADLEEYQQQLNQEQRDRRAVCFIIASISQIFY